MLDTKLYPEILYYGAQFICSESSQPVFKKLLPDGKTERLTPDASQKLVNHYASQKLVNHSPRGFNWGYSGSGPAQLSLALLLDATSDPHTAKQYYQDFTWQFVARWGGEWAIKRSTILMWLEEQRQAEMLKAVSQN